MPLTKGTKVSNTFVGGLITEATDLTFPDNAAADLRNCILSPKGNILRRLGLDYEVGGVLSSTMFDNAQIGELAITSHTWRNANNRAENNFIVVQIGSMLYFHEAKQTTPSTVTKTFTVDMSTFKAPAAVDAGSERIAVANGRGRLFVVSKSIEPFYVEYDEDADDITTEQITIRIRDFEGLDDGLDNAETPNTLSNEHKYNLLNQGWKYPNDKFAFDLLITDFFSDSSVYPANSMQWHVGRQDSGAGATLVDSDDVLGFDFGAAKAPQGYYILDAFNKDRSDASGVGSFPVVTEADRPRAVAFHAGRLWFTGNGGDVYFTQVLKKDLSNAGFCYQEKSPTAEDDSLLVDTDGGVIAIPEAGAQYALVSSGTGLIMFAENGVWSVQGVDGGGFKATDFAVDKVTNAGAVGTHSVIVAEGTPFYWSDEGIYVLAPDQVSGRFTAQSLTNSTIKTFYNEISDASQMNAIGKYDPGAKRIVWLYQGDGSTFNKYAYDNMLVLNVVSGAFVPYKVSKDLSTTPYVTAPVDNLVNVSDEREGVTRLKYLAVNPAGTESQYGFADFNSKSFLDWGINNYASYLLTGVDTQGSPDKYKQAPYITVFCNRTETAVGANGELNVESGLRMQTRWDYTSSDITGKFSKSQQVYRYRRPYFLDPEQDTFDNGQRVIVTRNKVLGRGRAMQVLFTSEPGKDFDLIGWSTTLTGNSEL